MLHLVLSYVAHVVPLSFFHILIDYDFRKTFNENKMCVLIFSITFV